MNWGDLFCGGGGTTTGAYGVPGVKVLWALNHSKSAIATHQANHPETLHYQADITVQDEHDLPEVDGLWMSSECTNFSIAKGGKLLDQGSRALPMQLVRFAKHCNPSVIIVENVREFVNWGPLIDGKTDKAKKGQYFAEWVDTIKSLGYINYEHRFLNAADYGAYTSRTRYFGIFTKSGVEIRFPEQTHSKMGTASKGAWLHDKLGACATLPKWKACREKINLEDYGQSIFSKNLCENTIKRIKAGLTKYGGDPFILSFYSSDGKVNNHPTSEPLPTITTKDRHAIVQYILKYGYSKNNPENTIEDLDNPISTLITTERHALITQIIGKHYNSDGNPESQIQGLDEPAGTITTSNKLALVTQFITRHQNSNGHPEANVQSIDDPLSTLTTKDKHALITQFFGDVYFRFISVQESKVLQGFPEDYKLIGSKAEQLRHIGNSVVPLVAQKLIECNLTESKYPDIEIKPEDVYFGDDDMQMEVRFR